MWQREKGAKIGQEIDIILCISFQNLIIELDLLGHAYAQGKGLERKEGELTLEEQFQNKSHCCNLIIL